MAGVFARRHFARRYVALTSYCYNDAGKKNIKRQNKRGFKQHGTEQKLFRG